MLKLILDFSVALLIGALVGAEREKKKEEEDKGISIGGLRTFILIALAGAISAWLSVQLKTIWIFVGSGLAIAGLIAIGYISEKHIRPGSFGITTEIAGIVVFLLGGTTLFGYRELAVALGIATAAVLAFKQPLHGIVGKLDQDDIYAGLKLLIASFIILPVLPNRTVDPWGAINPYEMWWLVILICGLSLVGYVATRWLGRERGTSLTGLFGGMVSSTAVTLTFSRRSCEAKSDDRWPNVLAGGILLAWAVMFVRVMIEVAVLNPSLLFRIVIPMTAMALLCGIMALIYLRKNSGQSRTKAGAIPLRNPFSLMSAIKFAFVFAVVLLLVKLVQQYYPGQGLYVVSALSGIADVDAITLSMAKFAQAGGSQKIAVVSITIATLINTLVKCIIVWFAGAASLKPPILIATIIILAGGVGSLFFV
jgi:uncharacterized membrane protein (DUF4010 family)